MRDVLWTGIYGAMDEICRRSRAAYATAGFSQRASALAVHPLLDNFVWEALTSGWTEPAADHLRVPVAGDLDSPARWFRRDHPADSALAAHLRAAACSDLELADEPCTPDETFARRLTGACRLLAATVPELWQHTAPFVTRVFDIPSDGMSSASLDHTGGAIFVSSVSGDAGSEADQIHLAACLLHEAAHSKSYRIFRAFEQVRAPESPDFIDVPWWRSTGQTWAWDVDRSIVAAHVYSHLATFYDRLSATRPGLRRRRQQAAFRARFLTNVLLQLPPSALNAQWRDFIEWTASTIVPLGKLTDAGEKELSRPLSSFPLYRSG